jgi:hypothetical protein
MSHVANAAETPTARLPCDTLERIVRLHSGDRPIDFLKVDAEGSEIAIVRSTDWRLLRPTVMVFEATLPWTNTLCNQEWEPILLAQGYARTYFDGINCFYVAEEACSRLAHCFETPVNVLDRVERYNAAIPAEVPGEPGPYPTGTLLGLAKRAFGLLAR